MVCFRTFLSAANWLEDYRAAMDLEPASPLPVILVGTKSDVENISVARADIRYWVRENSLLAFYEVSARDNTNVDIAVNNLLRHIVTQQ